MDADVERGMAYFECKKHQPRFPQLMLSSFINLTAPGAHSASNVDNIREA